MPLVDLSLPPGPTDLPGDVRAFVRAAERRVWRFQRDRHVPGFVPCDFADTYRVLAGLAADLPAGTLFCEWGSGFGAVTCLAALLDLAAFGIEIDADLVEEARRLANDFELPAEFACGSFIPRGGERVLDPRAEYAWFTTGEPDGYDELGLGPADFGVTFAYPWPDEERAVTTLFEHYAAPGALLMTCHPDGEYRLRRKIRPRVRRGQGAKR